MVACIGLSSHYLAASGLAGEVKLVHISTDDDGKRKHGYLYWLMMKLICKLNSCSSKSTLNMCHDSSWPKYKMRRKE